MNVEEEELKDPDAEEKEDEAECGGAIMSGLVQFATIQGSGEWGE
jgi:hypothetical protein